MPVTLSDSPLICMDGPMMQTLIISVDNLYEGEDQSKPLYAEIEFSGDIIEEMHCYKFTRTGEQIIVDFSQPGLYIPFEPFPNFKCLDSQTEAVLASFEITANNQLVPSDGLLLTELAAVTVKNAALNKATSFPNEGIQYGLRTTGLIVSDEYDNETACQFLARIGMTDLLGKSLGN